MAQPNCRLKSKRLTTWAAFDRWLAARKAGIRFQQKKVDSCPLARFANAHVYTQKYKRKDQHVSEWMPHWAVEFIREFDSDQLSDKAGFISAGRVRTHLRNVVKRLKDMKIELNGISYRGKQ